MKKIFLAVFALLILISFSACDEEGGKKQEVDNGPFTVQVRQPTVGGQIVASPEGGIRNQWITITPFPDTGYTVDWIMANNDPVTLSNGLYRFQLKENTLVTAAFKEGGISYSVPNAVIFDDGFLNGGMGGETDDGGTTPGIDEGLTIVNGQGFTGGRAIKVSFTEVTNYFGLKITFDTPINMTDVGGLSVRAKTNYTYTGAVTEEYFRPEIGQVVFGDYGGESNYEWTKPVKYSGEGNDGILLLNSYREIIVPVPKNINQEINTVMLYFAPRQLYNSNPANPAEWQSFEIYVDRIAFFDAAESKLVSVFLPEEPEATPYRPAIPYRLNDSSTTFSTALDVLTMDTRLVYEVGPATYTLFGKDGNPDVTQFNNRFTDFFENIIYSPAGGSSGFTINGNMVTPSAVGSNNMAAAVNHRIKVSYDGIESSNDFVFHILGMPRTAEGGTLMLEDFENVPTLLSGSQVLVQPPFFWGGWAGDAQNYGSKNDPDPGELSGLLCCWVADLMVPEILRIGRVRDDWFEAGSMGLNHDLTGLNTITVIATLAQGVKYTFGLMSGYPGVASTLNGNTSDGGRKSFTLEFTGTGATLDIYEFQVSSFTGVDLKCITGFSFFTSNELNVGLSPGNEFNLAIDEISAR